MKKIFFAQFNQIYLDYVIVYYENEIAIGCGASMEYDPKVAGIKRMFVLSEHRGKGIAVSV